MTKRNTTIHLSLAVACAAAIMAGTARPAVAGYTAYLYQSGSDVIGTGSGSFNITGLADAGGNYGTQGLVSPTYVEFALGTGLSEAYSVPNLAGPAYGSYADHFSTDSLGPLVLFYLSTWPAYSEITVPVGYVSGGAIGTSTSTWSGTTLASLGATPGTYVYTWGTGENADSYTLNVGSAPSAVPEPASLVLLSAGLAGLGIARKRRMIG